MPASVPPPEALEAARRKGDEPVRHLIQKLAQSPHPGPAGYNALLGVMDALVRSPELLAIEDSDLSRALAAAPAEFRDYFDPQPLPAWVDRAKLRRAAVLWEENTIALLFILYVASLPACYLLHRGIPALYRSRKLAKRQYLPQRLYETGLMLDAVLDADGLVIRHDLAAPTEELIQQALRQTGLAETWSWDRKRQGFVRRDGGPGVMDAAAEECLRSFRDSFLARSRGNAYITGRGVLAARKVRMLHGYMRHLLMHPGPGEGAPDWNTEELGAPVNQEDMAYTLLTFGYVLPAGLMRLGLDLSLEDREAFLHRWRLVGVLMGIDDHLLTDRWEEAEQLYFRIQGLEAGPSPEGVALTSTLLGFLETLLPRFLGLHRRLPVQFVGYLVGPRATDILTPEYQGRLRSPVNRVFFLTVRLFLRAYFGVQTFGRRLLAGIPLVATRGLHVLGEELIRSFREGFDRKPFYLPECLAFWDRAPGDGPDYEAKLARWRLHLFNTVLLAVGFWIAGSMLLFAALLLGAFARWPAAGITAGCGVGAFWFYGVLLDWWIPAQRARRPKPNPNPPPPPAPTSPRGNSAPVATPPPVR